MAGVPAFRGPNRTGYAPLTRQNTLARRQHSTLVFRVTGGAYRGELVVLKPRTQRAAGTQSSLRALGGFFLLPWPWLLTSR